LGALAGEGLGAGLGWGGVLSILRNTSSSQGRLRSCSVFTGCWADGMMITLCQSGQRWPEMNSLPTLIPCC